MSSAIRGSDPSWNGIVRRMVNLPRSILGGFSRVMGHGIGRIGLGGRRNQFIPSNLQLQNPQEPLLVQEEWAFLANFEQQYGTTHPFFYACRFMEALKIAEDDHKFMFVYLHSPQYPFTPSFCKDTLCSELVVQFLDANFISWGGLADRGEGLQMAATLQPASFPFCAVVAPAPGNSMLVLQQMEGPISPAEFLGILQRTLEDKGLAFGNGKAKVDEEMIRARAKEEAKIRADRQLREEQDAAYLAALAIDKEKERLKKPTSKQASKTANHEKLRHNSVPEQNGKAKEAAIRRETIQDPQATAQILVRFPNGERLEHSFLCTDKVQSIYRYIDSLGLPGIGNYRLISSFPRRVYGVDQMGMTLKDAGLHPRASLFLEPQ
ncbi:FAS-associated factor 2-B-like [Tripterygium wilfordii]|uniref:FAS-associated factor 2-B-like n=1 Tax=Tripterygium wilfordii TaxID=458696 RepID=A0A7J7CDG0_TRIWF|nr:plant UBX domain-containing protein 10-like [Tripterygium wilfordii]KAF5732169.1 FAS-associated factor 2-B-like [Tripterygium wilfordii]